MFYSLSLSIVGYVWRRFLTGTIFTYFAFQLYLKYLQEWVNIVQQEVIKKYILEEEWVFVKSISPHIPGGRALCGASFCQMASSMLRGLCNRFKLYKDRCSTEHVDRANFDEKWVDAP